jgi:hypothetical protein
MTTATGPLLVPHHAALIEGSAINQDVALARGYRSIGRAEAREFGFTSAQALPGLLIPLYDIWGEAAGCQLRPDEPRIGRNRKPIKYETPSGQRNVLDVLPLMRDRVRSTREAVFITEGARKADSLASVGIPAINLAGVWSWRGRNERGGKTALPDWNDVGITGSMFVLAFDNDVLVKPEVYAALTALRSYLLRRRASAVRILRLPLDGPKGIDDYIAERRAVLV